MSHYILALTERNGSMLRAACGRFVRQSEHTNEPTCEECREYVEAAPVRDEDDDHTARALEAEFPEFKGKLVTR